MFVPPCAGLARVRPENDVTAPITGYRIEISTDGDLWSDVVANTASTHTDVHARGDGSPGRPTTTGYAR